MQVRPDFVYFILMFKQSYFCFFTAFALNVIFVDIIINLKTFPFLLFNFLNPVGRDQWC